ncbi:MAG: hypothetical protein KJ559_01510 [Nanoarchaeota archaeon]|nr:hypothetical protein [Nanoarchaeota archaeon]
MNFETTRETLKRIGLGHNESKIYLTLLKLGPSMAGRIAKESNIDRSACYDSLKALLKKGIIKYAIEANRKKFSAEPPRTLLNFLDEKRDLISNILPDLEKSYNKEAEKSNLTMYKGFKGLKSVFEDLLQNAKENLVIDSSGKFVEKMPYYAPHFIRGLEKNRIKVKHLVRRDKKLHPSKTTEIRYLPKKMKETVITTNIYSGKIALILWTDVPEAIIIRNKEAYESFKDYFEILWKQGRKK